MKVTSYLQLVIRLRFYEAMAPLFHVELSKVWGQHYLYLYLGSDEFYLNSMWPSF